jgi:ribosome-associated protein
MAELLARDSVGRGELRHARDSNSARACGALRLVPSLAPARADPHSYDTVTQPADAMTDDEDEFEQPSKSERKRRSDDLQSLGEALIDLPESELDALPLPDNLRDAVMLARRITAHGGLYRQKQYIGKLMRKIDSEPIRVALNARRERERVESLRFHRIEQWRERLLKEGTPAIQSFCTEVSGIDVATLESLVQRARHEQLTGSTHASRELFRLLREALGGK